MPFLDLEMAVDLFRFFPATPLAAARYDSWMATADLSRGSRPSMYVRGTRRVLDALFGLPKSNNAGRQ